MKSRYMTSSEVCEITRVPRQIIYSIVLENAEPKSEDPIWVCLPMNSRRRQSKTYEELDLKATALLKLVYLEMFGHDMSWASFHVLEVMSSPKYHQKRVGYLGAVQSFRPDTEVLMLATNLLKKVTSMAKLLVRWD